MLHSKTTTMSAQKIYYYRVIKQNLVRFSLVFLLFGSLTTTVTAGQIPRIESNRKRAETAPEVRSPTNHHGSTSPIARVDIDSYFRNSRAMQLQIKCVVYDGPCDLIGKEIKKYIVVGLTGKCTDCSQGMRDRMEKIAGHIQEHYPQAWYDAIYRYLILPTNTKDAQQSSENKKKKNAESSTKQLEN